jgi:hypothetical protein
MIKALALGLSATGTLVAVGITAAAIGAGGAVTIIRLANGKKKFMYQEPVTPSK